MSPARYIYTDGSCLDQTEVGPNAIAGWGWVLVAGDDGLGRGSGYIEIEKFGMVETKKTHPEWVGAEVGSNNTAELSALVHAIDYVISSPSAEDVVVRSDSKYAIEVSEGRWKAKANVKLVDSVRARLIEARRIVDLKLEHIHAHRGHRWNERADHLARAAAHGTPPKDISFW